jgi:hypothetical protein
MSRKPLYREGDGGEAVFGSVLDEGPLLVKEKGGEEGGVAGVKDLGASSALAGEWDGLTNRKRAEEELEGRLFGQRENRFVERLVGPLGDDADVQVGRRRVDHRASGIGVAGKVIPSRLPAGSRKRLEHSQRPKEEI